MLGTFLSCHVFERDTQVATFLIHLGFALANIENTARTSCSAAHASHDKDPCANNNDQGKQVDEEVHEVTSTLVFITEIPSEMLGLAFGIDELF